MDMRYDEAFSFHLTGPPIRTLNPSRNPQRKLQRNPYRSPLKELSDLGDDNLSGCQVDQ